MVGRAPHMEFIGVPGRVGRVSKGKSDRGSRSKQEHDAENEYPEINIDTGTRTHTQTAQSTEHPV